MSLGKYHQKRKFDDTPEPSGKEKKSRGTLHFVVQKHAASHLHYDFRLEMDAVLKSWAVPKGPSLNPDDKRLAIMVEDHPLDYKNFEGIIPKGNYGAGTVIVWDEGTYYFNEGASYKESKKIFDEGLKKGHLRVYLEGKKLKGEFSLVRLHTPKENEWLLIKKNDAYASSEDITKKDTSVKTNKSIEDLSEKKEPASSKKKVEKKKSPAEPTHFNEEQQSPMPHAIKPMLATPVEKPFNHPEWVFEIKWDGYRAIAEIEGTDVHLYSRNNLSFDQKFPPVRDSLSKLNLHAVIDGEIVAIDKNGNPSFQALQNYLTTDPVQLKYYVFDLLYLNGYSTIGLTLLERKELLKEALPENDTVIYSEHFPEKGIDFYEASQAQHLEGIIAKNAKSLYSPGVRTKEWLKIKAQKSQEAIICGYTEPRGSRKEIGALILGVYEKNELIYIGHSGGGFTEAGLKDIKKKLVPLEIKECPFKTVPKTNTKPHWVQPELICEISFSEWTGEGLMRHPVFMGMRTDKTPEEITKDTELPVVSIIKNEKIKKKEKKGHQMNRKPIALEESRQLKNSTDKEILIEKKKLKLTNLNKIYWPKEKYTKGDLIDYYMNIADYMLPYLKDRPQSLNRYPNGIEGDSFFQKDVKNLLAEWIRTIPITSGPEEKIVNYLVCEDKASLIYMANLGCIEINPWSSRIHSLNNPDFMIIDLDPLDISFNKVIETALVVKEILDQAGADSYCKTSGATGLHILVPLAAQYDYEHCKQFAHIIASLVNKRLPKITSIERSPGKRNKRVYVDYLQNSRGQTIASAYSVRPKPGATVSTPLNWEEVQKGLSPGDFTIKNMGERLNKLGDIFKNVLEKGIDIEKCLNNLGT